MTVRMIVAAIFDCADPVGGGAGEVIGMSPANAETERTHVSAIVITKRFINFSFWNWAMQKLGLRIRIEQYREVLARFEQDN